MSIELTGTSASDGLFMGPVRRLSGTAALRKGSDDPDTERGLLLAAIARAAGDIAELIGQVEGEAQDILGFQLAMLEDDALSAPAVSAVMRGAPAHEAWASALDEEAAGYEASDDEYFRARAADLRDIRDRVLRQLAGKKGTPSGRGLVLVGEDIAPTVFLETDWSEGGAIALTKGSTTSHVAMLARARGIPMVVGLGDAPIIEAAAAIVDGSNGLVIADPGPAAATLYLQAQSELANRRAVEDAYLFQPARLRDGTRLELLLNVAGVDELDHIDVRCCDGIGLMRSEFLFRDGAPLPREEEQYAAYRRFVEWAEGRPVTIRTLDIGGDKPVRGLTPDGEGNPFLGLRGVRLTLARPDVFRTQLRALCRAAAHGSLKVMIPMVTVTDELRQSAALLDQCMAELVEQGVACARPPLGIMVEVPATAVAPELFAEADFFSIGSNDLTQYVTASSRDDQRVAHLNDPTHPAVVRLIANVARFGRENGIPVSLCGDMASNALHLPILVEAGVTALSVAPARAARVKAVLAEL